MQLEFVSVRDLSPGARAERQALVRAVFDPLLGVAGVAMLRWGEAEMSAQIRDENGRIVSTAGVLFRDVLSDGAQERVAGVCEVATLPEYRGQGLGERVMRRVQRVILDDTTVEFGLLLCPPERIGWYGKLGWERFEGEIMCLHGDVRQVFSGGIPMTFGRDGGRIWPQIIDLQGDPW